MKARSSNWVPLLLGGLVFLLTALLQWLAAAFPTLDILDRLEWMTYDWRVRRASAFRAPQATHLAAIFIDDQTLVELKENPHTRMGATWPFARQVHARVVRELKAQGARLIGMDIIFDQARDQDAPVAISLQRAGDLGFSAEELAEATSFPLRERVEGQADREVPGVLIESDAFFSFYLRQAGNVILAAFPGLVPHPMFRTNAFALGNVEGSKPEAGEKDSDGILRRFKAYDTLREWHPEIHRLARDEDLDLASAQFRGREITLFDGQRKRRAILRPGAGGYTADLGAGRSRALAIPADAPACREERLWQMGLVVAARHLDLDLDRAEVDLARRRILVPGRNGDRRVIPVDAAGRFLIDWTLDWNDSRILTLSYGALAVLDELRQNPQFTMAQHRAYLQELRGRTRKPAWTNPEAPFRDKLVFIGSTMTGNNLSDLGPTPLSKQTYLVSAHWNVANALLQDRFVRGAPPWGVVALVFLMSALGVYLTWQNRVVWASAWIVAAAAGYGLAGLLLYVHWRFWLPLVLPVLGLVLVHLALEAYWLVFAQKEQRRIKAIFSRLVAPEVVDELLQERQISLGGARRFVTVYFADVRGFTEYAEVRHAQALDQVRQLGLSPRESEEKLDDQAREVLSVINLYLGTIAEVVKQYHGTLDKYIGDCVMAFWGAPAPDAAHALNGVRAAIEAQRRISRLNQQRQVENQVREAENRRRQAEGQSALPLLPRLSFGTGLSTGVVTVGLMGSNEHILNYTVFGREVNLASRLEALSGRDRILISAATYAEIQRDDPTLAARCVKQAAVLVKGFQQSLELYEVPWREP
jgi:class 3 adenylate cyclase